jgi:hypothetical protein
MLVRPIRKKNTFGKAQATGSRQHEPQSILAAFLAPAATSQSQDEFELYCRQAPTARDANLIDWWWNNRGSFPTFYQAAFDKLAIPAMSVECERVFSSTKKTLTPVRNPPGDDIIDACECLKAWWDNEMIGSEAGARMATARSLGLASYGRKCIR